MATICIYKAATAASDGTTIAHPVYNARNVEDFIVSADVLAGVEEIDVYFEAGATFIVAKDANGVAYKITATAGTNNANPLVLKGGATYQFRKDTTATACGIYINEGRGITS